MNQLDLFTGPQLSEIGQQMSIDHADEVLPNWSNAAFKLVCDYAKMYGSIPFQAEQVRSYAAEIDFPLPPHARAWGRLFVKASKEGIIKSVGFSAVKNPKAHCAYSNIWVRI